LNIQFPRASHHENQSEQPNWRRIACFCITLLTNALRCLQLEASGYQVTVTELVGWEHSMKNELIIARNTGQIRSNAESRLVDILHELNLDELRDRFVVEQMNN
jgi:hypothetical protein